MRCPCNSGDHYDKCCEPLHNNTQCALSAEQLMRSRYSAFHLGSHGVRANAMASYIEQSCHKELRKDQIHASLLDNFSQTSWCGLTVIDHKAHKDTASVEFSALFEHQGKIEQHHENSLFEKIGNQWLYKSGKILEPYSFKRNQHCWCNSGKKYKHCHGQ